jgi:putative membrane protein
MTPSSVWDTLLRPERTRSNGRASWFTVLGLVLVPLLVGGLLTWALWKPTEHLDRITAAVVNLDEPVTVDGQLVPLGRQLAAGLVTSSGQDETTGPAPTPTPTPTNVSGHDSTTNVTWEITDEQDAADGLAAGRYAAVVEIPEGFSAQATSWADPAATTAEQAQLTLTVSDKARPLDGLIAASITQTATRVLGVTLTQTYIGSTLSGFTTMGADLTEAADGAAQVADGTTQLASGASQLATGADDLADGASQLTTGAGDLASGATALASGTGDLAAGTGQLASGATTLASGLGTMADQTSQAAATAQASVPDAQAFAAGLDQLAAGIGSSSDAGSLASGVDQLAAGSSALQGALSSFLSTIDGLAQSCATGTDPDACQSLTAAIASAQDQGAGQPTVSALAAQVAGGASAVDQAVNVGTGDVPALTTSAAQLAAGGADLVDGVVQSADGLTTLAGYLQSTAAGATDLADGASQTDAGAATLASGASTAAGGALQLFNGTSALSSGAQTLATGATDLSDGIDTLEPGTHDLAAGLGTATGEIPSYTETQAAALSSVIADPVAAQGADTEIFGSSVVPYFMVLALWLGGLAAYLMLNPTTGHALGSTLPSWRLALRSFLPAAGIGTVQGVALTAIMAPSLDLAPGQWVQLTLVAAGTGVAFAAANQGVAAAFRGTGRLLSAIVATTGLAAAVVSTVPGVIVTLYMATPLGPGLQALQDVTTSGALFGPVVGLIAWTLAGLGLTTAAIARHRVVGAGTLARWSHAGT